MHSVGAAILAGGLSSRMGRDKAHLALDGGTFLERIAAQLVGYDERLLSLGEGAAPEDDLGLTVVRDAHPGCGPIGGIHALLSACRSEWLVAVSCDMPLFERGLAEFLLTYCSDDCDAVVACTRDGGVHPLCAVYRKTLLPVLERQIVSGNYRIRHALDAARCRYVPLEHSAYPDEVLMNVNTPGEYRALLKTLHGPPVVAVSGIKNSGKTTLLCAVIPLLRERGLRVAVIKHDAHNFAPDVPGTDSYRLREAGACGIGVFSPERRMVALEREDTTIEDLLPEFAEADLILLEGAKGSPYPKIEVVRGAVSDAPVSRPDTLLAVCTDTGVRVPGVPTVDLNDVEGVVQRIMEFIQEGE